VPVEGSAAGDVLRRAAPERIEDVSTRFGVHDEPLGIVGAETALLVPLIYRDRPLGVLCVFDRDRRLPARPGALTNVAKHARATRVEVDVAGDGNEVRVRIADDGRGFDAEQPTEGFGLEGMRERAALMGGTLSVDTSERGTAVEARFPV
jgi:GAF domain